MSEPQYIPELDDDSPFNWGEPEPTPDVYREPPAPLDAISAMIHEGIAKNTFNAAAIANGLHFGDLPDDESRLARARIYRAWRRAGENVQAAFARTLRGEPAPTELELHAAQEREA